MDIKLFNNQTRFKIALTLIDKDDGMSIKEIKEEIKDVPQATLYRHINSMYKEKLLKITKRKKIHSIEEKFYALNVEMNNSKIDDNLWGNSSKDYKVNFLSYLSIYVLNKYKSYLENSSQKDKSTISLNKLNFDYETANNFQKDLNELLEKYYKVSNENDKNDNPYTISINIIPPL
ncbi:helix-turn-helix domain-containing protein [Staphylococcus caprae]|uniref:helix-turn-helix domain-containing protein n=1 Tax=Staphylococcus caprae TaxID=29380 RepID=UPI003B224928